MKKSLLLLVVFLITGMTINTQGQALSGDYYIPQGANPQGFASLNAAVTSLNANGVSGTVNFILDADELRENTLIFDATLTETNNVVIKPAPGRNVVLYINTTSPSAGNGAYLIGINSPYLTFDGSNNGTNTRNLTISTEILTPVVDLPITLNNANADNVVLKNLIIKNIISGQTNFRYGAIIDDIDGVTGFRVENCQIGTLSRPVRRDGLSPWGLTAANQFSIINNEIYCGTRGVATLFLTNSEIIGNTINILPTTAINTNNYIHGIYITGVTGNLIIHKNEINILEKSNVSGTYVMGIAFAGNNFSGTDIISVVNNIINVGAANETGSTYGIGLRSTGNMGNLKVYFNTILINNNASSLTSHAIGNHTNGTGAVNIDMKNNILINNHGGNVGSSAIGLIPATSVLTSDYNILFSNQNLVNYRGTTYANLSSWQATIQDLHSISKSINFVSAYDLHLTGGSLGDFDLKGTPVEGITTDFDNQTRTAVPYMGADEITNYPLILVTPRTIAMDASINNSTAFSSNGLLGTNPTDFYVHWDATYLYLGWNGGKTNYSSDMFYAAIDTDPEGTNGTSNAIEGVSFLAGGQKPDYYVVYENNSSFYGAPATEGNAYEIYGVNEGNWVWISRTGGNDNISSRVVFNDGPGEIRLRIPWATINFVPGASNKIGIVMWNNNASGNYLWAVIPASVPLEGSTPVTLSKNFVFNSTGNDVNPSTAKSETVLPVELSLFKAKSIGKIIEIQWSTATELNVNKFIVERKTAEQWVSIGEVNASGNSNSPKEYSFTDKNLAEGKYSYRLKMIDNDGTFEYSQVVEVEVDVPNSFTLSQNYPNPFNPVTQIQYQLPVNSQVKLVIYTITGELVTTLVDENQVAGSYTVPFNASGFASGTYIYRLVAGDFVATKKMVVLK